MFQLVKPLDINSHWDWYNLLRSVCGIERLILGLLPSINFRLIVIRSQNRQSAAGWLVYFLQ